MKRLLPLALLLAVGCGDKDDTGPTSDDTSAPEEEVPVFDPEDPGVYMFLTFGGIEMMGQVIELGMGGFMPAAREDFDQEADDDTPVDSCVVVSDETPVGECSTDEDCAPEQECVPDYDDKGSPIAGSEHCSTPRDPIDVGSMTVDGLNGGPVTMSYNAGQSGAYTTPGGDGSLSAGTLAYDTTYTFYGDGDEAQGLGAFTGEIYMPAQLALTSPAVTDVGMGMMGITVGLESDLTLTWSGSSDGVVKLDLAGASFSGESGAIHCLLADDGEHTIPADMVAEAHLGELAMLNIMTLERATTGTAEGEGLTMAAVDTTQTLMVFVQAQ
jgi:hypothetical protein